MSLICERGSEPESRFEDDGMNYEKPQKGNARLLTVDQHTLPKTSIARFTGQKGNIQVFRVASGKTFLVKPTNQLFCAKRAWDQRAETGFMRTIEDDFQAIANRIIEGELTSFKMADLRGINEFYCLWNIRSIHKQERTPDQSIDQTNVVGLSQVYTKDEEELLEQESIGYIRGNLTLPGRILASRNIWRMLQRAAGGMSNSNWRILRALEGEFIVPDNAKSMPMLPLSPTVCLWCEPIKPKEPVELLARGEVVWVNRAAVEASTEYYFARDLDRCPR